jgi:hypothetical protein
LFRHPVAYVAALACVMLGFLGSEPAHAGLSFRVSADTSSLSGQSGFLDFQFNPADSSALAARAAVTNFTDIGGTLAPSSVLTGDATGSLPGTLALDNSTIFSW